MTKPSLRTTPQPHRSAEAAAGFSLVELLLALTIAMALSGLVLPLLIADGQNAQRLARLLRERSHQRRTLALIRLDLERATAVVGPGEGPLPLPAPCGLDGRTPVLQLRTPTASGEATVTYSVGAAPSGIWEGRVLVRCGPAYGLDGGVRPDSAFQSRVVLDRLASQPTAWTGCGALPAGQVLNNSAALPFSACVEPASQLVVLRLQQSLRSSGGRDQRLSSEAIAAAG